MVEEGWPKIIRKLNLPQRLLLSTLENHNLEVVVVVGTQA